MVDGRQWRLFRRPGVTDFRLTGLSKGSHTVRLEKLTESQQGGSRFIGFYGMRGTVPLPPQKRPRQVEFIGDSYTVGYGNTSPTRTCTKAEVHDRTNTQAAFGPIVARHHGADYRVNAYSGIGIVHNDRRQQSIGHDAAPLLALHAADGCADGARSQRLAPASHRRRSRYERLFDQTSRRRALARPSALERD